MKRYRKMYNEKYKSLNNRIEENRMCIYRIK